jgi:hypothetical protein
MSTYIWAFRAGDQVLEKRQFIFKATLHGIFTSSPNKLRQRTQRCYKVSTVNLNVQKRRVRLRTSRDSENYGIILETSHQLPEENSNFSVSYLEFLKAIMI